MVPCNHPNNPRANIFIIINLGCEMLYVIDQRLQAQQIDKAKATQVFHEITAILLNPQSIESVINDSIHEHSQLLSPEKCRCIMDNIATGSLMRLDEISMNKLWNLMTMVYKWQLFVSQHPIQLLDITFRHLNTIAKLYPDDKIIALIEYVKNLIIDFWNSFNEETQFGIYYTNKAWLESFNTKISLLIRLGFQSTDGSFLTRVKESYINDFAEKAGGNIYQQSVDIAAQRREQLLSTNQNMGAARHNIAQLQAEILGMVDQKTVGLTENSSAGGWHIQQQIHPPLHNPIDGYNTVNTDTRPQDQMARSMLEMGIFSDVGIGAQHDRYEQSERRGEFVSVNTVYNRNTEIPNGIHSQNNNGNRLNKNFIDFYRKLH